MFIVYLNGMYEVHNEFGYFCSFPNYWEAKDFIKSYGK